MAQLGNTIINGILRVNGNINTSGSITASSLIGDLTGNASTATLSTKATQDADGNIISSTYLKNSGGNVSGHIILNNNIDIRGRETDGTAKSMLYMGSDNTIRLGYNNVSKITANTKIVPLSNNTVDLGESELKWNTVYATTFSGNAVTATKLATARKVDGVSFDGSADIIHYGTCSTAAATAAKTVACSNYTLVTGSRIVVKFTVTNTAANPTLNVNSTGAKNIFYKGAAIPAGYLVANQVYEFVYDGTQYVLVGDVVNTVYSGTSAPDTTLGKDGDIFVLLDS